MINLYKPIQTDPNRTEMKLGQKKYMSTVFMNKMTTAADTSNWASFKARNEMEMFAFFIGINENQHNNCSF